MDFLSVRFNLGKELVLMKALYVFQRIFHFVMVWAFILAGALTAFGVFYLAYAIALKADLVPVGGLVYYAGLGALILIGLGVLGFALSHIFKMARKIRAAKLEEAEECCCCCECEKSSELDEQVEEVMKWKNLYVEGIITEREFIDKRNEILRLSK